MIQLFRFTTFIVVALVLFGCSNGDDTPYIYNYEDVAGRRFVSGDQTIEFVSENTLRWTIALYRYTPVTYDVAYTIVGNSIEFEAQSSVRTNYSDPVWGESFTITHYNDTFKGEFKSANAISADVQHSFEERVNDLYLGSAGALDLSITYRSVN